MKKLIVLLLILTSCSTSEEAVMNTEYLSQSLGKEIILEGNAESAKLGALMIVGDSTSIWIDGLESWPEGYYSTEESKWVRATGKLIEKYDLPVFISEDGKPHQTGIPVPKGTDLKKASHRYLLKDATWEIIDE